MNRVQNKKKKIIFACILVTIILIILYAAYYVNLLSTALDPEAPNMTIEIRNDSNKDIGYSVLVVGRNPVEGNLDKSKKSEVNVVYPWNLSDKLEIKINDKEGKVICETKPNLKIIPQHLYNPYVKYKLEAVFKNNQLQVVQIK